MNKAVGVWFFPHEKICIVICVRHDLLCVEADDIHTG